MWDASSAVLDEDSEIGQVESGYSEAADGHVALHARFMRRKRQQAAWDAEEARDLRAAEHVRLWEQYGCARFSEYLEVHCSMELRTALERIRVARLLGELPLVEAELEEGTYTHSHVRELVRVAVPETEEEWVEHTRGMTYREVREAVSGLVRGDRPGDAPNPNERLQWFGWYVKPSTSARIAALMSKIEAERGEPLVDDDDRANAFCDAADGGGENHEPAQVWLTPDGKGFANGVELDAAALATLTCDATMMGSVDDPHARAKPAISKRNHKRLRARDGNQCSVPGCRSRRHLDLHHIVPRSLGGDNSDSNMVCLCSGHHRLHHRGLLLITGLAPDQLEFTRVRGDRGSARVCT